MCVCVMAVAVYSTTHNLYLIFKTDYCNLYKVVNTCHKFSMFNLYKVVNTCHKFSNDNSL